MEVLDPIRSLPAYRRLVADIRSGIPLSGLALPRAVRLPVLVALQHDLECPVLFLTGRTDQALTALDEIRFWKKDLSLQYFPEPTPLFYEQATWGTVTRRDRLLALTTLARYHMPTVAKPDRPPLMIGPVRAVMTRTLPRRDFIKSSRLLKLGQKMTPESLLRSWVEIGYEPADVVLAPGQFARRGGLLDIWPPAEPFPVRLDFFGDELDTIRRFDPASQRTVKTLESLLVTPAREVLPGKAEGLQLPFPEVDEFVLPLLHPTPASLLDYLPKNSLIVVEDMDLLRTIATDVEEQAVRLRQESITEGTLPADFPVPYITWSELSDTISAHSWVELGYSTAQESEPAELSDLFHPGLRFAGRLKPFMDHVEEICRKGHEILIVSRQVSRLKEVWSERDEIDETIRCKPRFVEGTLGEGWVQLLPDGREFHLFTDSEVFGWERPQPRQRPRPVAEAPESSFADLRPGDWVVHVDYGIGRYVGLVQRTLEKVSREFLQIEYDGGDQLFVPVHQADRLSRYVGPDSGPPSLTRLGTQEWQQTKQRVREAVLEVAQELLELYARRRIATGFAFSPDTVWQQELEASFPYIETEDQLEAIKAVKADMESSRPMDRLLCGDVGYGKTEVALRAAFKAVMDGKQVAMLVPTTVLAQQHFDTFRQRLAAFPVNVEMLSRFRTAKEQDQIVRRLAGGEVDIVIGTHRLLQPDVQFKDLGLLIIDEEQRFGVTHKEYFKKMRTEIDVLTLTATPIPRTLYMALTGVRDISVINTPPSERLPIVTHIGPYSPRLVRQAVLRELERGGQVFFVHNRVQTIRAMEKHLNSLIPEARIVVAHGQMPENELAAAMHKFTRGEVDVLLCTSIIESGLDIPNANTLIVDRGDAFGLAQLYQLRGRVGRGAQRAYAYFFRHRKKAPTIEGQERLETIAENTQLGAGYSIAMRDLEMRGAGELLGTRQHGMIASVGFHLYTRLLGQAVAQLRQVSGLPELDTKKLGLQQLHMAVSVDLPLSIGLPVDYVREPNARLGLYRRIAHLNNEEEIQALRTEFVDRFGPPPPEVENLFFQIRIKLLAEQAGLASVSVEGDQIVLRFPPLPDGMPARNLPPIGFGARAGKNAYWLPIANGDWQAQLVGALEEVAKEMQPS